MHPVPLKTYVPVWLKKINIRRIIFLKEVSPILKLAGIESSRLKRELYFCRNWVL